MRKLFVAGVICFASTALWAEEGTTTTTTPEKQQTTATTETMTATVQTADFQNVQCKNGKMVRKVEVARGNLQSKAACEVYYQKDAEKADHKEVLWSAKADASYCDIKAKEFVQKLGTMGWTCEPSKM